MKGLVGGVMHEIQEDDCFGRAAQLAYYCLFALFSSFLFLTTLWGNLPIPNLLDRIGVSANCLYGLNGLTCKTPLS